ncbi:MAG: tetratricopeptide repeat protein [Wenzhouxiangellaceae bacterium]|nr:tetratricopeptide repeat protein [Wenzhouxiangellaceae bacterium]
MIRNIPILPVLVAVLFSFTAGHGHAQQPDRPSVDDAAVLEGLPPSVRNRVFPYIDKALREQRAGNMELAIAHWRNALERAPQHLPIVRSLAEALFVGERPEQALTLLEQYRSNPQLEPMRQRARIGWLASAQPPPADVWLQWLAGAEADHAARLVETYAFTTVENEDVEAALSGLQRVPCPGPGCARSLRLRAALAEQAERPAETIAALEHLARLDSWNEDDERRAVGAWIVLGDWEALADRLDPYDPGTQEVLLREAAQRAIGQGEWNHARDFFERLKAAGQLTNEGLGQLTEIYQRLGDLERAADAARQRGNCLEAVALAGRAGEPELARRWLADCPPVPSETWLELAIGLEAIDLLAEASFSSGAMEARRVEALATLLYRRGRDNEVIALVREQRGRRAEGLLVQALDRQQRYAEAADVLAARHALTGAVNDLDRASWFYLLADRDRRAAELLLVGVPFADDEQGRTLSRRLLELYPLPELDPGGDALARMANATNDTSVSLAAARTMQRVGLCDRMESLDADTLAASGDEIYMLLGFCLQHERPGIAAHYFARARKSGNEQATEPLAVLLLQTGQTEASLPLWRELDESDRMTDDTRAVWVEAALQAGRVDVASEQFEKLRPADNAQWWSMQARIQQRQGKPGEAIESWANVHRLRPDGEAMYQTGVLHKSLGNIDAALEAFVEALEIDPENPEFLAGYAYALEEDGSAEQASEKFAAAVAREPWRYRLHEQLGYLNARLRRDEAARESLRTAIDRLQPELPPPDLDANETLERRYAARRTHEALGRRWSMQASGWAATGAVPGEFFFDSDPPRNYAQIAVSRRLGDRTALGNLNVRGRLLADGSADSPLTRQAATIGLTWQLPTGISVIGVDWISSPDRRDEFLLHGATEVLSGGDLRRDWRPVDSAWQEQRLFLEGAWWTRSNDFLLSARYDRAWHRAIDDWPGASWYPYLLGEARRVQDGHDVRLGAGIGLRRWTGEGTYDAYRRVHSIRLEFQHALETDIADNNGIFLRIESEW